MVLLSVCGIAGAHHPAHHHNTKILYLIIALYAALKMEYKWTALTVTGVGVLMAGLDSRITVIGLPTIAQQLHVGAEEAVWITESYLLTSTICLLLIGRLSDIFGRVKLYNIGFVVFTVGSALSAVSLNAYQLIGFRIVEGVGAAILITNSSAVITDATPKNELGTMLGINQTMLRVGNIAGLTLSGLILSLVDWRGLFYVNIPIGIFGTIWAQRKLREIAAKDSSKKMDWVGLASFSVGLTLVLLAIDCLSYGLSSFVYGLAFLLLGCILLLVFVKIELSTSSPLLDFRLFKSRLFAMGNIAQLLNALVWNGIGLLLAFYLQIGLGYTPLQAGLGILPLDATYLVFSLVGGKLSDKYGSRFLCTVGLLMMALSFFFMSTFGPATHYAAIAFVLAVVGIGNGLFTPPNLKAIMESVPANRTGIASAFRNTMFNVGLTASYGLIVLLLTFGIPYDSFSLLLQQVQSESTISLARFEFFNGFRIATLILAIIDAIAIVPPAVRGQDKPSLSQGH